MDIQLQGPLYLIGLLILKVANSAGRPVIMKFLQKGEIPGSINNTVYVRGMLPIASYLMIFNSELSYSLFVFLLLLLLFLSLTAPLFP